MEATTVQYGVFIPPSFVMDKPVCITSWMLILLIINWVIHVVIVMYKQLDKHHVTVYLKGQTLQKY